MPTTIPITHHHTTTEVTLQLAPTTTINARIRAYLEDGDHGPETITMQDGTTFGLSHIFGAVCAASARALDLSTGDVEDFRDRGMDAVNQWDGQTPIEVRVGAWIHSLERLPDNDTVFTKPSGP